MALPDEIHASLQSLKAASSSWRGLGDKERAVCLRACRKQLASLDMTWVEENLRVLGIEPSKRDTTNSLGMDPFTFMACVGERMDKIADRLEGKYVGAQMHTPERQLSGEGPLIHQVGNISMSCPGCKMEIWSDPNVAVDDTDVVSGTGGVCVVLGAGNQNFLTAVDCIECLFNRKACVLLKHHPIRPFMSTPFVHIFAPVIALGAFAQCLDSEVRGRYAALVSHHDVAMVHMTGSGATHDSVVAALKAAKRDDVVVTSELGCVTPWIICPGATNGGVWQDGEIDHHATMLAACFKINCSMNCLSPKLLVLPSEEVWPQRHRFLQVLRSKFETLPQLPPYYPGGHDRYAAFKRECGGEEIASPPAQDAADAVQVAPYPGQDFKPLPSLWVDVGTLGTDDCRSYALVKEAFAPVLAIATAPADSASDFPLAAARAVNRQVFGTLSCNLMYPDPRDEHLDTVLNELNYGCISVNFPSMLLYGNALGLWGGAPGSYREDKPESGLGFVGNAAGIPNATKCVGIGPFLNPTVSFGKPLPMVVLDSLMVVASGKRFVVPRILGILLRRGFGLIPRKLPAPPQMESPTTKPVDSKGTESETKEAQLIAG